MKLVAEVYKETAAFPQDELYGLTSQIRRAAVSIPSNIAEGSARNTTGELVQFLGIATGSLAELETQLEIGEMLKFLPGNTGIIRQVHRVGRLLSALRAALKDKTDQE